MATTGNNGFKFFLVFLAIVLLALASYFFLSESIGPVTRSEQGEVVRAAPDTSAAEKRD